MPTQAMQRRSPSKRFNPSEYRTDFADLMAVNPGLAANAATTLARSKREAEREVNAAEEATADIIAFLVSSGIVALVGMWDGTVMARRDAILQTFEASGVLAAGEEPSRELWKAQGVKEPGKLWIFPTSLIVPIVLGGIAVAVAAGRDEDEPASVAERIFAVSATSTFGLFVANLTRGAGYRWQQKRMIGAAAEQAMMTG